MPRKNASIDQFANVTVRQAQSEMAMMQRDLNQLRDGLPGLTRGIKTPAIKTPRTKTKKTTATSALAPFADIAASSALDAFGLSSGYSSAAQNAGNGLAMLALGQRIR